MPKNVGGLGMRVWAAIHHCLVVVVEGESGESNYSMNEHYCIAPSWCWWSVLVGLIYCGVDIFCIVQ